MGLVDSLIKITLLFGVPGGRYSLVGLNSGIIIRGSQVQLLLSPDCADGTFGRSHRAWHSLVVYPLWVQRIARSNRAALSVADVPLWDISPGITAGH